MKKSFTKVLAAVLVLAVVSAAPGSRVSAAENGDSRSVEKNDIPSAECADARQTEAEAAGASVSDGQFIWETENSGGWDGTTTQAVYEAENYRVTFSLSGCWEGGYNAGVEIENTGDSLIENWCLKFDYPGGIADIWNGETVSCDNGSYVIKNAGWNRDIAVGGSVRFGFSGKEDFKGFPQKYELLGDSREVNGEDYTAQYVVDSDWGNGFTAKIVITNHTDAVLEDWTLEFDYENEISSIWDAEFISHEENHYIIHNAGYNQNIEAHASVGFGFVVEQGSSQKEICNVSVREFSMETPLPEREREPLEDIGEAYFQAPGEEDIVFNDNTGIIYVKNQLLISAMLGVPKDVVEQMADSVEADIVGYLQLTNDYQIAFREEKTEEELDIIMSYLNSYSYISNVTLNSVVETEDDMTVTTDTEYGQDTWDEETPDGNNWGLEALKIPSAWDYSKDFVPVRMGVIDNMFDEAHEDLQENFEHVFNNSTNLTSGHGTHVAGIMAASRNNVGIAGVVTRPKLYGYAKNDKIPNMTSVMEYKYAFANLVGNHVKVINVSYGTGHLQCFAASRGNEKAINYVKSNAEIMQEFLHKLILAGYDFVIVTSAGNVEREKYVEDSSQKYGYRKYEKGKDSVNSILSGNALAEYNSFLNAIEMSIVKSRIIVVGSVRHSVLNNRTYYYCADDSNVGERVDVCAPGVDILSTVPGNQYGNKSGTSMAAPHIAGVAGLLYQAVPGINASLVKSIICGNISIKVNDAHGKGYGLPDAVKCVETALKTHGSSQGNPMPSGMLVGMITDQKGKKLEGVKITACRTSAGESNLDNYVTLGSTDENGNYEMVLQQGTYNLNICAEGYFPCMIENVEIAPEQTNYMEQVIVMPAIFGRLPAIISGKVVHALNGTNVAGASIKARKGWNNTEGNYVTAIMGEETRGITDNSGKFSLGLPVGIYTIEIKKDGFVTGYYNVISVSDGGEQTVVLTPMLSEEEYRIVLTWGKTPADLDSHLLYCQDEEKKMQVCFAIPIGTVDGKDIAKLDLDDTSSYGPETITVTVTTEMLSKGKFKYLVHDYTNRTSSNSEQLSLSGAVVRVYKGNELVKTYSIPQGEKGTLWHVFDITENGIIPFNTFSNVSLPSLIQ